MGVNLTNLYIDETFEKLTQISGSKLTDGLGNDINLLNITASYALNTEHVSASYALSASHADNADTSILAATASLLIGNAEGVGHIDFINSAETTTERRLNWNDTDGTLNIGLKGGNVSLQVGQELVTRVVNKTGINLLEANYKVVKVLGAQGNRLSVALALADADINSASTLGLVTENIPLNQEGFITTEGLVRGINTTGALQGEIWNEGDILYLSGVTPGGITNVKPATPTHLITLGYVVAKNPSVGSIFVKVNNGYELEELHDVLITNPINGEALVYENGIWINSDIPHVSASYAVSASQAERANGVVNTPSLGNDYMLAGNTGDDTVYKTNVLISGSNAIQAAGGFFGNLIGNADTATSASYALTASYALNAGGGGFPYTGSALITGSLGVTGSISAQGPLGGTFTYTNRLNGGLRTNEIDFTGQDLTQFRSDDTIAFDNTYFGAGTGSMSFNTNGNLAFNTYAGGDISANTDGTVNLQAGQDVILEADNQVQITSNTTVPFQGVNLNGPNVNINLTSTGSTDGTFAIRGPFGGGNTPGILLTLGTGSYGSNPTTSNMLFTGDDSFFQAEGTFYIKNIYNDTGSVTVWSENLLTLRGDTGVYIGADPFGQDVSSSVEIDIEGKTLLNTVRANVLGFSTSVTDYNVVPDDTRAFVEGPLEIGDNGTIIVPINSDLKVLDPFGTPITSAVSASYATTASYALNGTDWDGVLVGNAQITGSLNVSQAQNISLFSAGNINNQAQGNISNNANGFISFYSQGNQYGAVNLSYSNPSGSIPLGTKNAVILIGQKGGDPTRTAFGIDANDINIGGGLSGAGQEIRIGDGNKTSLLNLQSSGSITLEGNNIVVPVLGDYINDTAAASGGVPINGLYRTGNDLKVRLV